MVLSKLKSFWVAGSLSLFVFLALNIVAPPKANAISPTMAINATSNGCDASITSPLTWIICPVIDGLTAGEGAIEQYVFSLLKTPVVSFGGECGSTDSAGSTVTKGCTFKVWSNFRIYGNVFLIIALLIAVIVEIVGGGAIANYTIKKMLPRIVVAVILINLSIYIVAVLEDVVNIIGAGLFDLIKAPFGSAWKLDLGGLSSTLFSIIAGGGAGLGLAAVISLGWAGIGATIPLIVLTIVLPVVLAVLSTLITLMVRQGLLVLLIMTSPVAFALYCLPNTEAYFKKWWGLLLKTLMVYPIIVGLIAMSQVMGIIFTSLGSTSTLGLPKIMGLLAVAAPLFLIPFGFRISGGMIGAVYSRSREMGQALNTRIRGRADDPTSQISRARDRAGMATTEAGISRRVLGARIRGRREGGIRQLIPGQAGAGARATARDAAAGYRADEAAISSTEIAARQLANDRFFQQNKQNDEFIEAGTDGPDSAVFQQKINDARALGTEEGDARAERLEAGQRLARRIRSTPGSRMAFAEQKAANGRTYGSRANWRDAHEELMRDAMAGINDVQLVTDANGQQRYTGSGAAAAERSLAGKKAALRAAGFSHLGNAGSTNANAFAGTDMMTGEELSHQKPSAYTAIGSEVQRLIGEGNLEEAAIRRQELINVAEGNGPADNKAAARAAIARIDAEPTYIPLPAGMSGPGTPGPTFGAILPTALNAAGEPIQDIAMQQARRADDQRRIFDFPPTPPTPPPAPPTPPTPPPAPPTPPTPPTYPRWSDDIIDIDSSGRPRTPSGEFMSYENADVAEANADFIRDNLPPTNNGGNGQNNP